jgi:hypothetical protein
MLRSSQQVLAKHKVVGSKPITRSSKFPKNSKSFCEPKVWGFPRRGRILSCRGRPEVPGGSRSWCSEVAGLPAAFDEGFRVRPGRIAIIRQSSRAPRKSFAALKFHLGNESRLPIS